MEKILDDIINGVVDEQSSREERNLVQRKAKLAAAEKLNDHLRTEVSDARLMIVRNSWGLLYLTSARNASAINNR